MMDGELASRPFGDGEDLVRIADFLRRAGFAGAPQAYLHPGDLVWGIYQNTVFDARRAIRLWERKNELLGFAMLEEPDGVLMQVHPRLRGSGEIEGRMLEWAADGTRAVYGEEAGDELWVRATEDPRIDAFLLDLGFEKEADHALKMARTLEGPIPDATLPEGWTVGKVGGEGEWEARVALHREVWHPSKATVEAYRRLRTAPVYDGRLDLVARSPDRSFGAYCICWFDPVSRSGLFEPVGTRPACRGMGLGRAVVDEGLRRLRNLGARTALVTSIRGNDASTGLYDSTGFRVVNSEHLFWK